MFSLKGVFHFYFIKDYEKGTENSPTQRNDKSLRR